MNHFRMNNGGAAEDKDHENSMEINFDASTRNSMTTPLFTSLSSPTLMGRQPAEASSSNASFDAFYLRSPGAASQQQQGPLTAASSSWDEHNNLATHNHRASSTRINKQQHKSNTPRRNDSTSAKKVSHGTKLTPSSAKRRSYRKPKTPITAARTCGLEALFDNDPTKLRSSLVTRAATTTAGSSTTASARKHPLETESDAMFRFPSFPASLPRCGHDSDDDDDDQVVVPGTPVFRTKLDFTTDMLSPTQPPPEFDVRMELTDGHWFNSKPAAPKVSIGATPSLAIGKFFSGISDELSREGLLQRNTAQCSPIPGIPEEVASTNSNQKRLNSSRLLNDSLSGKHNHLEGNKNARPMPDMHAFEGDASTSSLSDDTSINSPLRRASKLQCPPTPVRTPIVYAHMEQGPGSHVKFSRNNSLTVTKVLATCPPRVRQGRESLENSVLDDDVEQPQKRSMGSDVATELDSDDEELWHASPFELSLLPQQQQQQQLEPVVSMVTHFTVLSALGSGAFADVYRVRSKVDGALYAVKRNRRQFRSKRDREKAMNEVKWMQLLQRAGTQENESNRSYSLFLLFFYQAWQEDGHFYVQTELCCRDTCRGLMDSLRSKWPVAKSRYPCLSQLPPIPAKELRVGAVPDLRMFPEDTIWKIFHDVAAGLSHIHSHGLVHFDIKPENCFLVSHGRLGAMVKIGDFGLAGAIGSSEDGQEGDTKYMPPELLLSDKKHPSADIFSLGLTLYEIASCPSFHLPSEGALWHELRNGQHSLNIPTCRSKALFDLIQASIRPEKDARPTADSILNIDVVATVGGRCDTFLRDYLHDVEDFDAREEFNFGGQEDKTPRHAHRKRVCSPTISNIFGNQTLLYSPETAS